MNTDIKNLVFKYVDKVVFAIMALMLAIVAIYSPIFGDTFRPMRDVLDSVLGVFLPVKSTLVLEQLQTEVNENEQKIKKRLDTSTPPRLPEFNQLEELKSLPPPAVELRAHLWGEPGEVFDRHEVTATVPSTITLKERMAKEAIKIKDPDLLKVEIKTPREIMLIGQREGETEFYWRDTNNVRHTEIVKINKFVPQATVSPPPALRASMEGASIRLVWDAPTVDSRAPVTSFNVYRRKAEEAEFTKIGTAPVSEGRSSEGTPTGEGQPAHGIVAPKGGGTYVDEKIEYDTKYVYAVKSVAPSAPTPESAFSPTAEVETPSDTEFFVKILTAKNATIKIWKFINKEWKWRNFSPVPGEMIGGVYTRPARGSQPAESVDFRTGCILVDIDPTATRMRPTITTRLQKTERGLVNVDEAKLVPDMYRGKILYLDKRGVLREKWMGKEVLDDLYKRFPGVGVPVPKAAEAQEGVQPGAPPAPSPAPPAGPQELKPTPVP